MIYYYYLQNWSIALGGELNKRNLWTRNSSRINQNTTALRVCVSVAYDCA